MIIPSSVSSVSLSDLVTRYNYWGDDDGDGQGTNGITATGSISVSFTDKNGNAISRSDALSICFAPYKVTLASTEGSLTTQYGVPRSSSFSGATVDYYINPYGGAEICSVRPNLTLGGTKGIDSRDSPKYAGPASIWDPKKGFLVQSTSPSSYDQNFPTTGSDGLYFDLELPAGLDGSQLTWSVVTNGSIRATVSWTRPRTDSHQDPVRGTIQHDVWITDKSSYVTRVTLSGPRASDAQISSSSPSRLAVPSLPQTFELVGRDSHGNELRYGFVLRQWFVHRVKYDTLSNQTSWCRSLGYRLSQVRDLTNVVTSYPISGATPSSSGNYYQRNIGAGFFTEWGVMYYYADAGFVNYNYWTSDAAAGSNGFTVYTAYGTVYSFSTSFRYYAVCAAP
ncbi:hypothetical protein A9G39_06360 [Gilliamella sp. Imp1-6]|nr:hypothetical protein A9G31_08765 [Gilliamella apicola]OCG66549.1 hypothetical protein A9G39_06360 [Gilliamella apicola]